MHTIYAIIFNNLEGDKQSRRKKSKLNLKRKIKTKKIFSSSIDSFTQDEFPTIQYKIHTSAVFVNLIYSSKCHYIFIDPKISETCWCLLDSTLLINKIRLWSKRGIMLKSNTIISHSHFPFLLNTFYHILEPVWFETRDVNNTIQLRLKPTPNRIEE